MPSPRLPAAIRKRVAERAGFRCEYCRSPADCSPSSYSVEHVVPRAEAGSDEEDNLAWSCMGCNDHKYTAVDAIDPVSGEVVPLFHPRRDPWDDHFAWVDDFTQVVGLTPSGRATVEKLRLNRLPLLKLRRLLRNVREHP